jgi:hypothetical protein
MSRKRDARDQAANAKTTQVVPGVNVPLVIKVGVTGHKDIVAADEPADGAEAEAAARIRQMLERRAEAVLNYFDLLLSNTTRSYRVVSPLAEGGDIILTDAILKHAAPRDGLFESPSLQLVLPMPEDVYLAEFKNENQKTAFLLLKDAADNIEAARKSAGAGAAGGKPVDKSQAYRDVTKAVASECDILLAAWDGEDLNKTAGTAATVSEAERLGKVVVHIRTPRLGREGAQISPLGRLRDDAERLLLPLVAKLRAAPKLFRVFGVKIIDRDSTLPSLRHLDTFIKDLQAQAWASGRVELSLKDPKEIDDEVKSHYRAFRKSIKDDSAREYFEETFRPDLEHVLLPIWRRSSKLARQYQHLYNRAVGTATYILAASAVVTVSTIISLFPSAHPLYWLEVLEVLGILSIVWLSRRFEWHRKRIEYRMLSERLRAAIYLYIAGIDPEQLLRPAYFHSSPYGARWVVDLFKDLTGHMRLSVTWPRQHFEPLRNLVCELWLGGQFEYYKTQGRKQHSLYENLEAVGLCVLGLTVLIAISHALGLAHEETAYLDILALSLPAVGVAIGGILAHREYRKNARRYRLMARLLEPLKEQALKTDDLAVLQGLLREAHDYMLQEQQTWLLTVGVEPPTPA